MLNNDEEEEIKIEYFEQNEHDPLNLRAVLCAKEIKVGSDVSSNEKHGIESIFNNDYECDVVSLPQEEDNCNSPIRFMEQDNFEINTLDNKDPVNCNIGESELIQNSWYKSIDSSGRYICNFCELAYSTVCTLRRHITLKHKNEAANLTITIFNNRRSKKHKCHICKKRFKSLQELSGHVKLHNIENVQSCHLCSAHFPTYNEKSEHLLNIHNVKIKSVIVCNICGYQTFKLSHMNQHNNTHSLKNMKKCSFCSYSTNYPSNLRIHERIHTKEMPYGCDYEGCSYRSATKTGLTSHQLRHNRDNNLLFCDKCGYSTVYKLSLKKHIASHSRNSIRMK